jgi:DHA1 family tetracycline resistance protein-like MFS transporter
MFGLGAGAVGFAIFGYAPWSAMFLAAIPIQAVWGVASPAIQSIMSRRVEPSEQGRLQGAITSIRGIGGILGPFLFTNTFRVGIEAPRPVPGAALYLAAALLVIALLLVARGTADYRGQ